MADKLKISQSNYGNYERGENINNKIFKKINDKLDLEENEQKIINECYKELIEEKSNCYNELLNKSQSESEKQTIIFGNTILKIRMRLSLSKEGISKKLHMTSSSYSRYEQGQAMNLKFIKQVLDTLDLEEKEREELNGYYNELLKEKSRHCDELLNKDQDEKEKQAILFGKTILKIRSEMKLSQKEMAKKLRISRPTYYKIEQGLSTNTNYIKRVLDIPDLVKEEKETLNDIYNNLKEDKEKTNIKIRNLNLRVSEIVRTLHQECGISLKTMGSTLNISEKNINRVENGKASLSIKNLQIFYDNYKKLLNEEDRETIEKRLSYKK